MPWATDENAVAREGWSVGYCQLMSLTLSGSIMTQITARLSDELVRALDQTARTLNRSRAEVIRQAVERYVEDFDDLSVAIERLRDPADPVLDWDEVKRDLLGRD